MNRILLVAATVVALTSPLYGTAMASAATSSRSEIAAPTTVSGLTDAQKEQEFSQFATAAIGGDATLLSRVVTADFIWFIPGKNLISGCAVGVQAAINRGHVLSEFQFKVTVVRLTFGPHTLTASLHGTGSYNGKTLDMMATDHVHFTHSGKIDFLIDSASDADLAKANKFFSY